MSKTSIILRGDLKPREGSPDEESIRLRKTIAKRSNAYLLFILKKFAFYFIVFFVALSLAFLIPRLIPGPGLRALVYPLPGEDPARTQERYDRIMAWLGLDKSLWDQYVLFFTNFFKGDLGWSFQYNVLEPVSEYVTPFVGFTMILVVPVVLIAFVFGNWIGGLIGFDRGLGKSMVYYMFVIIQCAPFIWLAWIINDILMKIGVPTTSPFTEITRWEDLPRVLNLYWVPFITLLIGFTGGWATGMRSMTVYEADADYILYCRKLGFKKAKLRTYAMRNALLPQYSGLNLNLNNALGATVVLELVFAWPGIGRLLIKALPQDFGTIIGVFIYTIIIIVVGNFLIDITYPLIDPRIKSGRAS